MKILLKFALLIVLGFVSKQSNAQNATGNASDNGVALTTPPPQLTPGVNVNTPTLPPLNVPTAPPVQTLPSPTISPTPGIPLGGILPAVPSVPIPPPLPPFGTIPPVSTVTTTLNLPLVPLLPPIPAIPAKPDVKLPRG